MLFRKLLSEQIPAFDAVCWAGVAGCIGYAAGADVVGLGIWRELSMSRFG